jgi:hypothetical protein
MSFIKYLILTIILSAIIGVAPLMIYPSLFMGRFSYAELITELFWWAGLSLLAMSMNFQYSQKPWMWIAPVAGGFSGALLIRSVLTLSQYSVPYELYFRGLLGSFAVSIPAAALGILVARRISKRK